MNTSHYPSLELCKKLKELWFWTTEKRWFIHSLENPQEIQSVEYNSTIYSHTSKHSPVFPCPSVIELLNKIPDNIIDECRQKKNLEMWKKFVAYSRNWLATKMIDWTLPNALAEMWLWLKENNYLPTNNL